MNRLRIWKHRPDHWPPADETPGEYETPWGVLVVTEKHTSSLKETP